MTTVALSRHSSDLNNDDSTDGGFQFAHPLFANAQTPHRTEKDLQAAQTSPIVMMTPAATVGLITPAQPTYTRFGRRQPLAPRRKSQEGQTETPGATLHTKTASVARWKRTGRIGLGPPKRAERQSMDEEEVKENVSPEVASRTALAELSINQDTGDDRRSRDTPTDKASITSASSGVSQKGITPPSLSPVVEPTPAEPVHVPPPKMSLDDPAPTAARKAKTLGRIIMNGREYTRLDQIGKGGSSKVFRVMAPNGKIFALKRVDFEQADQATILGYKSEIDLLRRMSSSQGCDRIIKLYDAEINDARGRLLMLMEAGEIDLAHMLTKRQTLTPDFNFIRLYWRHMLEAVQAVHEQKIVHSDLKPANFLLVEGSLKLIDFGIAKAIGNDTTNIHRDQQVGTVNYMSPEALSDTGGNGARLMKLGRASDVWSLGCILYQMVYGRTPFSHLTMIQKIQAIPSLQHRIEFPERAYPPSMQNDKVKDESASRLIDGDLLRVMRGCLERDQSQRLTIESLLQDPFLCPEDKIIRVKPDHAAVSIQQIQELLRLAVSQTRERTMRKEPVTISDIDHLARDFCDRLRWS